MTLKNSNSLLKRIINKYEQTTKQNNLFFCLIMPKSMIWFLFYISVSISAILDRIQTTTTTTMTTTKTAWQRKKKKERQNAMKVTTYHHHHHHHSRYLSFNIFFLRITSFYIRIMVCFTIFLLLLLFFPLYCIVKKKK